MGQNVFRFTLDNPIAGSKQISEPDGWNKIKIILERDKEYHSVIEMIETPFIFYGSNRVHDGGMDYLDQFKLNDQVTITIEISQDNSITWETMFVGLIDIQSKQRIDSRKVQYVITRNSTWTKFKNHLETPVNIQSANDLYGNAVNIIDPVNLELPSQKIRYNGNYNQVDSTFTYVSDGIQPLGCSLDWDNIILDDVKKFTLPRATFVLGADDYLAVGNFEAPYAGRYIIDVRLVSAVFTIGVPNTWQSNGSDFILRLRIVGATVFVDADQAIQTVGSDTYLISTLNETLNLNRGDQVAIYGIIAVGSDRTVFGSRRLDWISMVDLATTRSYTLVGEQVVDGVLTSASDVLVRMQANQEDNGIYTTSAGAWTRRSDTNTAAELNGIAVRVNASGGGTTTANSNWRQENVINTLGVDPVSWVYVMNGIEAILPYTGAAVDTHLKITADTLYFDSVCESLFLHDVAGSISDRIIGGDNKFYSEYLGSTQTNYRAYDLDGCGWAFILAQGLQIRQYTLAQKQFSLSFKNWWDGINPIENLGLGYDTIDGQEVIRVEEKQFFYDTTPIIYFNWANNIIESYDKDYIFSTIKTGYKEWQSLDISGIDDPQTNHDYSTLFQTVGQPIDITSSFVAAGLAIESTRRTFKDKANDNRFDDKIFIIAINPDQLSSPANTYKPELNENFNSITNLLNPETRYNSTLTPARNLVRWGNLLFGCLQDYLTSVIKFNKGEGNYAMIGDYSGSAPGICFNIISDALSEKQDISLAAYGAGISHLFQPIILEFKYPLSYTNYKLIRDNRKNAIAVSESDSDHSICFIKRMEYDVINSLASFTVWKK